MKIKEDNWTVVKGELHKFTCHVCSAEIGSETHLMVMNKNNPHKHTYRVCASCAVGMSESIEELIRYAK